MRESAQKILKEALSEQMEAEAGGVLPTEELREQHTFSEQFLAKMRSLIKRQAKEEQEKTDQRKTEQGKAAQIKTGEERGEKEQAQEENVQAEQSKEMREEKKILRGFFAIQANREARRIAAACLVCVILLGAGLLGYQGLLRAGRSGSDSSSSLTTATTDGIGGAETEEEYDTGASETGDEETAEESVSGTGDITDEEESVSSDINDDEEESENSTAAETDYAGASLTAIEITNHSAVLEISNKSGAELSYGEAYELEYFDTEAEAWIAMPLKNEMVFAEVAYIMQDGETDTWSVDWSVAYGSLSEGTYRIVKEIQASADESGHRLTAEFEIE